MRRLLPLLLALALPAGAHAAVDPYGTNDAGGFRNVLPPGSNGTANAFEFAEFTAIGARPATRLRRSLRAALLVERAELYGGNDCVADATARCFDLNRNTIASAIAVPDMSFQNRPTFQQTVSLDRKLPR